MLGALVNDKQLYTQLDETTAGLRDTVNHAQAGVTAFQENMEAMKQNFLVRACFKKRGYESLSVLEKNEIAQLPETAPLKTFMFDSKQLFDKEDAAKPKNQKTLRAAGEFLADTKFGIAVVVVSTGRAGYAQKDLVLTQARAMVVRDYLVGNFSFDDTQLKTLGLGKGKSTTPDSSWALSRSLFIRLTARLPHKLARPVRNKCKRTQSHAHRGREWRSRLNRSPVLDSPVNAHRAAACFASLWF